MEPFDKKVWVGALVAKSKKHPTWGIFTSTMLFDLDAINIELLTFFGATLNAAGLPELCRCRGLRVWRGQLP